MRNPRTSLRPSQMIIAKTTTALATSSQLHTKATLLSFRQAAADCHMVDSRLWSLPSLPPPMARHTPCTVRHMAQREHQAAVTAE